ncbi:MAG: flagellar filament capping protein FliD [Caldimicrobium sp.]|nr:flagellar filament capping protein FliD [Caldimicrobium sp.]
MADELYLSNVTGLLDVDAFVKSLTQAKQKELQKIAKDKALHQAKASSISNLLSGIKDLKDFVSSLNIDKPFQGKSVSVSDSSVISAQASANTPNLTLKVKVNQLSQAEMRLSTGGVSSLEDTLSSATFTLRYYTSGTAYEETTINFSGGKLNDLVNAINSSQNRVQASVFFDGSSYKLLLSEKDVGASTKETIKSPEGAEDSVIEIASGSLPSELGYLKTLQEAKNAQLELPGGSILTSPTNTFKDVLPGLTITAQKTSTDYVSITISDDLSGSKKAISDLLNKINGVLDLLKPMTEKGGLFQGNSALVQIKASLFRLTKPLQELGLVNIGDDGKYSLRSEAYDELLSQGKVEDVKKALASVKEGLSNYLEGLAKTFTAYKNAEDQAISRLDKKTEELKASLSKEEKKLRLIFSKIEALMNQNEALKTRLESFVKGLSETSKR